MKKIYLIVSIVLGSFLVTSCNKWLDVQPQDIVDEKDLFAEGTGYRNALNGVYRQISSQSMYGCTLTYGAVESLAQMYNSYSMHSSSVQQRFLKYNYTDTRSKAAIASLWETTYKAIANCNNIIVKINDEPASKFMQGQREKELILGEALALRGFLHFLAACYFAPAPRTNSTGTWIPYFDTFPQTTATYLTVEQCLERCVEDLKLGQGYVKTFDTYSSETMDASVSLAPSRRFTTKNNSSSRDGDIFTNYRGYRMSYPAITAILARVYSYAGKYDLAAVEAQTVIDFKSGKILAFTFTRASNAETDYKLTTDLIFTLGDDHTMTNYLANMQSEASYTLSMNSSYGSSYFDSASDYRKTKLLNSVGRTFYPLRYTIPKIIGEMTTTSLDMLPVIRLSEMYYIKAEGLAAMANYTAVTELLDDVREGRGCPRGLLNGKINSPESFQTELLNEVRREFIQEGLTFYYFKKYGVKFTKTMIDEAWYFPRPDSENIF